ncbi:FAD-dependent oxidoreductase [Jatrophihabitans cynanchi]|uniref:FAD-dependent oxidoreductase n=1 Tax=Jatrophihabitans cynanchi TaxID=2944128 RepID=A0ABY7K544_9ACTN|nr:FAD-dependent oxidoreductase [Jatrophihabitans sp. SB3-54]WAX58396.1 FAD-dependent oxidoreductase [Jatrophihabitans sp. SB3-54]
MVGDLERSRVALVVGGSIAGALAAGVLADSVDRVIVVERDPMPDAIGPRRGVPHAQHFHTLLARGRDVIESIYPGFTAETVERGAVLTCMTRECLAMRRYGWAPRFESPMSLLLLSRELIEWTVRQRARRHPRVEFLSDAAASGLVVRDGRVSGLQVRRSGSSDVEVLDADLIVDATGRQSKTPDWLVAAGYSSPEEVTVDARWGYSSCFVEVPDGFDPGYLALSALPRGRAVGDHPSRTRGAAMWVQDGDSRWILTAMGSAGDHPPADPKGFFEFIASLEYAPLDAAVAQVRVIGTPRVWRNTVNRLRRYDQATMPDGLLVVGDAFAAFNPVYGQGMTVAALAAHHLRTELAGSGLTPGTAGRVQSRIAEDALFCWRMATGADYRVEGVVGPPPPPGARELNAVMDRIEALTAEDQDLYLKFWETAQLLRDPSWMYGEEIQLRVREDWNRLGELVGADG